MTQHVHSVGLLGLSGRLGQALSHVLSDYPKLQISVAFQHHSTPLTYPPDCQLTHVIDDVFSLSDLVLDVSHARAFSRHLTYALHGKKPFISCVTGLKIDQKDDLQLASQHIPILYLPNASPSYFRLVQWVETMAATLDCSYDIEILDTHHRDKTDAPSGTARDLAEAARRGRQSSFPETDTSIMYGMKDGPRTPGNIHLNSRRGGGSIGEHQISFLGTKDQFTLTHQALDRNLFAHGCWQAVLWMLDTKPKAGLYGLQDIWANHAT